LTEMDIVRRNGFAEPLFAQDAKLRAPVKMQLGLALPLIKMP